MVGPPGEITLDIASSAIGRGIAAANEAIHAANLQIGTAEFNIRHEWDQFHEAHPQLFFLQRGLDLLQNPLLLEQMESEADNTIRTIGNEVAHPSDYLNYVTSAIELIQDTDPKKDALRQLAGLLSRKYPGLYDAKSFINRKTFEKSLRQIRAFKPSRNSVSTPNRSTTGSVHSNATRASHSRPIVANYRQITSHLNI